MPIAILQRAEARVEVLPPASVTHLVLGWALMVPFIFFAVHGNFSFQQGGGDYLSTGSLGGLVPTRNLGLFGNIIFPGIAYSVVAWLIAINFSRILGIALQMKALTFLALLTICSAIWSQNPIRSSYNGLFYMVGTLFAYYLVVRFEPEEIMTTLEMAGCLVCLMGLVLIVFFPQFALSHDIRNGGVWKGIFIDRTSAAKCLVFLLSPALVFGYHRLRYFRMAYICLLTVFIVMAHAVTALIVLCCYAFFMAVLYFFRRLERKTALILGTVGIAICVLLIFAAIPYAADIARLFGRDLTLTGRTEVWEVVTRSILKRPLLGYGFYSFWQGMTGESAHAILATHWGFGYAHNGMLEILLQLGFVGLIVFLLSLLYAIGNARICLWHGGSIGTDWYIGLIVLTVLYNFDEATVVLPNELLSVLYIIACCGLARAAKQLKED